MHARRRYGWLRQVSSEPASRDGGMDEEFHRGMLGGPFYWASVTIPGRSSERGAEQLLRPRALLRSDMRKAARR